MSEQSKHPHPDPLIDEVRSIRKALSDAHGNDVDHLVAYLQRLQQQSGRPMVPAPSPQDRQKLARAG